MEKERERNIDEREKHRSVSPLVHILTTDWTCNLGMCPDQEWNEPVTFRFAEWHPTNWANIRQDHLIIF